MKMNRREFFGTSLLASLASNDLLAKETSKREKSIIMIWLAGGPPTIDMWDLKPGTKYGGPFKPISTTGDFQISEHLPLLAKLGNEFSLVRSMSTREADHMRGSYYLHTGFKPSPTTIHPSIGSTAARELTRSHLEIPSFFSINTSSFGGGYLGTAYNPFVINSNGSIQNIAPLNKNRLNMLGLIESGFEKSDRGEIPSDHRKLLEKTIRLNTSVQMKALSIDDEPIDVRDAYGTSQFGRGALIARRLIQQGVPFVEVGFGGWDLHQNTHEVLQSKLPELDKVVSSLIIDLKRLDLLQNVSIIMMGEFGRTPRINQDAGRDHWASSWSAFVAGGGLRKGVAIGETNNAGTMIDGPSYSAEDLLTTICADIGLADITYTSKQGRPMKIAGGGTNIHGL